MTEAPDDRADWAAANAAFLAEALAWLRAQLAAAMAERSARAGTPPPEPDWSVDRRPLPALLALRARFGLSPFETKILLLCAGMELDPEIAALCRSAQSGTQSGGTAQGPSFGLCLSLFPDASWEALSPHRGLRAWGLIEVPTDPHRSLVHAPLRTDERIVHYLKGLNEIDVRLAAVLRPETAEASAADALAPSQQAVAAALAAAWGEPERPLPVLTGTDLDSKVLVATDAAEACGRVLCRMPAELIPAAPAEFDAFERLWRREQILLPLALLIEVDDAPGEDHAAEGPRHRLRAPLDGAVVIAALDPPRMARPIRSLAVAKPTRPEQALLWRAALGDDRQDLAAALAGQFTLSAPAIARLGTRFGASEGAALWEACREALRPRLDRLARRVAVNVGWSDLVLPADCAALLRAILSQVRDRRRIHEDWGFGARSSRGLGISALFTGESGTGKTLAAEVLAATLGLDLYLVDLSGVVSKYIGETEKNLRRLFDAAEDSGAILFFDEADALFGKRSEVRDSHDRYANIEVNYLLQRMEAYRGLAILATNLRSAIDPAFLRRLRFVVMFPYPGPVERQAIWQRAFPPAAEVGALDWTHLGRLNLTGGNIATVALNAAFLASAEDSAVEMRHVLEAARAEFIKLDRPFRETDFLMAVPAAGRVA
jgi:hypothetical protein